MASNQESVGGTVDVGTNRRLTVPNPHVDRFAEPFVTGPVLPPLLLVGPDWVLTPWLAADLPQVVEESPEFRVRWTLRSDAVWNDGSPVTSRDVARTLDYVFSPETGVAATLLYQGARVEIVDDLTFDVVYPEPVGAHQVVFSTLHPVIKADAYDAHLARGEAPADFLADGIDFSAGPYMLSGFEPGERLTLVRNENFWGEAPLLDRITVRTYETSDDQLAALRSGELDLVYVESARATQASQARAMDDAVVDVGIADGFLRLDFNTARGPTADPVFRRAIAEAIDRHLLVETAVTPVTGEAASPLESLVWASSHPANGQPFAEIGGNTDAAETLLQEAGWERTDETARYRDGELLELRLVYAEGASLAEQVLAQGLVVALSQVGVRVRAEVEDRSELFATRTTGNFDMVLAFDAVNTDPVAALYRYGSAWCPESFGADGCTSSVAMNLTGTRDAELDELLAAADAESDADRRIEIYNAVDDRLAELVVALPLHEVPTFVAYSDRLGGIELGTHRGGPFAGLSGWGFLEPGN